LHESWPRKACSSQNWHLVVRSASGMRVPLHVSASTPSRPCFGGICTIGDRLFRVVISADDSGGTRVMPHDIS